MFNSGALFCIPFDVRSKGGPHQTEQQENHTVRLLLLLLLLFSSGVRKSVVAVDEVVKTCLAEKREALGSWRMLEINCFGWNNGTEDAGFSERKSS